MVADKRDLECLRQAPWLKTAAIARVFAALATTGAVSRAVGGAVRNTLLGEPIDDIDIATTARPEQVLAAAKRAGLNAIATGLAHGTVTLNSDGMHFEVTTLRRDVQTDGRHATVDFTDDWALDASRRDFTINALYATPDGMLFDPLGGAADLLPTRVRFIGDARTRIREDYLRILRFFRFSARYGSGELDAVGLAAAGLERGGLARISAERIRVELLKLLATRRAAETCRTMQAHGFLVGLLGVAPSPGRLQRLIAIEAAAGLTADPIRRLAALGITPFADVNALARRLRLSGEERGRLQIIAAEQAHLGSAASTAADAHRCIYRRGAAGYRDALLLAWAARDVPDDGNWRERLAIAETWPAPRLPVTGQDVMALGIAPGPFVGDLLQAVEAWWVAGDFQPDRAACLAELARRAASGSRATDGG